jgi:hypothetical protein
MRPADEDRAGGRNTLTRFADEDLATERRELAEELAETPIPLGSDQFYGATDSEPSDE